MCNLLVGRRVAAMAWGASDASNAAGASSEMRSLARPFSCARGLRGSALRGGSVLARGSICLRDSGQEYFVAF